jgi:superfamily I DNA/RNA helicase/RecB family exonuclease
VELTAQQQEAVNHRGRRLVVFGTAGTGKTTTLIGRYLRLAALHPPTRLLVVCRNRAAARRFTDAVLPHLRGGFDALPITTVPGLAYDLVARTGRPVRLLSGAEQRALIRRLLAAEDPAGWPAHRQLLGRRAFADEVADGLDRGTASAELAGFARRYAAHLDSLGAVDWCSLLTTAAALAPSHRGRFDHVLVDDIDSLPPVEAGLVAALVGDELGLTATAEAEVAAAADQGHRLALTRSFRAAPPGTLVRCGHPSVEAEVAAGLLLDAHREGVPWQAMAVLVPRLAPRARAIGRALARHGIPVVPVPALASDEPVVQAVVDMLRWVEGDDLALDRLLVSPLARLGPLEVRAVRRSALASGRDLEADPRLAHLVALRDHLRERLVAGDTPAELAYEAWARGLTHVGATGLGAVDDRSLDALVAFIDGLNRTEATLPDALAALAEGEITADPWRAAASAGAEGVTITSIDAAAGREWHTVVVAGCVEGELPATRTRAPLFEVSTAPTREDRLRDVLANERRRFAVASTRATTSLLATAAPQPGVLLSRFVEAWPERPGPIPLPLAPGRPPPYRSPTAGPAPVALDGRLTLSATQLDTYDDCPLRYAFQYVLRARDEPGVHANLGSLVHEVLAEFLDPNVPDPAPRTLEGLLHVADAHWSDEIARYRPQVEEARRDFVAMLSRWWEEEGSQAQLGPEVLAVERRFDIEVGPHRLVGTIDRIDRADDGVGLRVVDYKTGKSEPKPADVADNLQLAIYHLAASRDAELAALGAPSQLQLRYLRSMRCYQQPVTDDHATRTEVRVLEVADRILAEDFDPSVDANCRTCSFHRLCPLQPEGRQVGV